MKTEEIRRREREYRFIGEVLGTRFLVYKAAVVGERGTVSTSSRNPSAEGVTVMRFKSEQPSR
jgi:hypothetical protein